jgi:hypothetical protein
MLMLLPIDVEDQVLTSAVPPVAVLVLTSAVPPVAVLLTSAAAGAYFAVTHVAA